jgi:hypothetical protein
MMLKLLVAAAISLVVAAAPARAEVVTLLCTASTAYAPMRTVDIDFASHTACTTFGANGCKRQSAQITDRYIVFNGGSPITIDRTTGVITWADGSQGSCQRANKVL